MSAKSGRCADRKGYRVSIKESIEQAVEFAASDIADHHEYTNNKEFNLRLDDSELSEYYVYLAKPDGSTQQLEPTSKSLFFSDRATYRTLLAEYRETLRAEILRYSDFPENEAVYERLKNTIRSGATVIPFVGAGFSVASGCPSWSDYIVSQAVRARMDAGVVKERLSVGEHELVMDKVIAAQTIEVFARDFRSSFDGHRIVAAVSPSSEFIGLLDGPMITINFDRVLEDCHTDKTKPFREKVVGTENTGRFIKAIYAGEKYLLKLHGNIDEQNNRVLTKAEYESRYGSPEINFALPIPKTLKKVFSSFSVLFCGCSLIADRYLQVLKHEYDFDKNFIPNHFAILVAPDDPDERVIRDRFLACHGISPIWFAEGDWSAPENILQLLKKDS